MRAATRSTPVFILNIVFISSEGELYFHSSSVHLMNPIQLPRPSHTENDSKRIISPHITIVQDYCLQKFIHYSWILVTESSNHAFP